jgi:hypothetical protein
MSIRIVSEGLKSDYSEMMAEDDYFDELIHAPLPTWYEASKH